MQRSQAFLRVLKRCPFEQHQQILWRHRNPDARVSFPCLNHRRPFIHSRKHGPNSFELHDFQFMQLPRRTFLGFGDGDEESGLSKHHKEHRLVGYSPEQLFAVVAAVDLYEDFVPWCQKSTVLKRSDGLLEAELEIGFKFFVERYISHVELKRPSLIKTSVSKSNLFKYLINEWEFKPGPIPGSCNLQFVVDFQFRSPLYSQVVNMFYNEVVSRLVSAFEDRCNTVYGPSSKVFESGQVA